MMSKNSDVAGSSGGCKTVTSVVAEHYDKQEDKGLGERTNSRIFHLRNFNNWVKSMQISDHLQKIKRAASSHVERGSGEKEIVVLDLCCGKGGDLLKWKKGGIGYVVCADISKTSVERCESRYRDLWQREARFSKFHSSKSKKIEAEFMVADCTRAHLKNLYKRKDVEFDIVSCQFSFHYCFESLQQANRMLLNISECLRVGGFFIGTTPDANEIMRRLRDSKDGKSFGNQVYSVTFQDNVEKLPLFGAKYDFHLEDVVDCPEFLVYFPLLEKLALKHNLKLIYRERFDTFYERNIEKVFDDERGLGRGDEGRGLLGRMQAMETYPAFDGAKQLDDDPNSYKHAQEFVSKLIGDRVARVGTLSVPEWEVASMYVAFAFEKT